MAIPRVAIGNVAMLHCVCVFYTGMVYTCTIRGLRKCACCMKSALELVLARVKGAETC